MKARPETLKRMLADASTVLASWPTPRRVATIRMLSDPENRAQVLWPLWNAVCDERLHDDTHPRFATGDTRVLPHDPTFEMYPDETDDATLETALLAIADDLRTTQEKQ